jgi:hypothetical protein
MNNDLLNDIEVNKRLPALMEVSSQALSMLGSKFTQTPQGHIQTDIAAMSSVAGLIVLQETVRNLKDVIRESGAGNVLLSDVHESQGLVFKFIMIYAASNGIDVEGNWNEKVPKDQEPLLRCEEMTRRIAPSFYRFCAEQKLERDYWKIAAATTSVRLLLAGKEMGILEPNIGKTLALLYVAAGSKTIPYEDALWPDDTAV